MSARSQLFSVNLALVAIRCCDHVKAAAASIVAAAFFIVEPLVSLCVSGAVLIDYLLVKGQKEHGYEKFVAV